MCENEVYTGYLDVKVSDKVRRRFTPWKAWHKQWCEIKRLDKIENGAKLVLKTSPEGAIINSVTLPRSSILYRIESRSKNFAFGIFGANQKPVLFLSGNCESDTQRWMLLIRKMLSIASYIPIGGFNFFVSLIDNAHSRAAKLMGLFGILAVNSQEITICSPTTGEIIVRWKWLQFQQFYLQATAQTEDDNTICVMHTNRDFITGPGHLYFYCVEAPHLLNLLLQRGKSYRFCSISHRLSQSESDISKLQKESNCNFLRSLCNSEDLAVGASLPSEDSGCITSKPSSNIVGILSETPGGSETDDDDHPSLCSTPMKVKAHIPRGESGISIASGVYEEISETLPETKKSNNTIYTNGHMMHLYEDPKELSSNKILNCNKTSVPPPLPPRIFCNVEKNCDTEKKEENLKISLDEQSDCFKNFNTKNIYKCRSSTLPTKDLRRLSQTLVSDSEYVIMTPKNKKKAKNPITSENMYVPMSPIVNLKTKLENCYMVMSGKRY